MNKKTELVILAVVLLVLLYLLSLPMVFDKFGRCRLPFYSYRLTAFLDSFYRPADWVAECPVIGFVYRRYLNLWGWHEASESPVQYYNFLDAE